MKKIISLILVLIFAAWLGLKIKADPGYVLLSYQKWSVETSLWVFLCATLLSLILITYLFKLLRLLYNLPKNTKIFWNKKKQFQALGNTNQAFLEMLGGEWKSSAQNFLELNDYSQTKLVNYLYAAKAYQQAANISERDNCLRQANEIASNEEKIWVSLTQAQLQIENNELDQALLNLRELKASKHKNIYVLELLAELLISMGKWDELLDIFPDLERRQIYPKNKLFKLKEKAVLRVIKNLADNHAHEKLVAFWNALDRNLQNDPHILATYIEVFSPARSDKGVEKLITQAIKHAWHEELIAAYGLLQHPNPRAALKVVEEWIGEHAESSVLFLTLGKLAIQNQVWGKAETYLLNSLKLDPANLESRAQLGILFEYLGERERALECYRQGINELFRHQLTYVNTESQAYSEDNLR